MAFFSLTKQPIRKITLASYDWINLQSSQDYDRLVDVLDPEFDPKGIVQHLKSQVTAAAKGLLVEHGYVDKHVL